MLAMEPTLVSGVQWAWLAPALSVVAFFAVVIFGRYLPWQGSFMSVLAILGGFATFCYVLGQFLDYGGAHVVVDWFTVGGITLTWGIMVDELSLVMLGLVTFVALAVQVYSLGYMAGERAYGWYFAVHLSLIHI